MDETARFDAPPGQTCSQYAGQFAKAAGGYFLNPDASNDCQYCQLSIGNQYLAQLNVSASDKWRDFGIFLVFVCTNWMLVYFFIYTVRIRGWGFGLGYVFGGLSKLVDMVKKPLMGLFSKKKEEQNQE